MSTKYQKIKLLLLHVRALHPLWPKGGLFLVLRTRHSGCRPICKYEIFFSAFRSTALKFYRLLRLLSIYFHRTLIGLINERLHSRIKGGGPGAQHWWGPLRQKILIFSARILHCKASMHFPTISKAFNCKKICFLHLQ